MMEASTEENFLEGCLTRESKDKSELAGWMREKGSPRRGGRESMGHSSHSDQLARETGASFPRNLGFVPRALGSMDFEQMITG